MCENAWKCMKMYENVWKCVTRQGVPKLEFWLMGCKRRLWAHAGLTHGSRDPAYNCAVHFEVLVTLAWKTYETPQNLKKSMKTCEFQWKSWKTYENAWDYMKLCEKPRILRIRENSENIRRSMETYMGPLKEVVRGAVRGLCGGCAGILALRAQISRFRPPEKCQPSVHEDLWKPKQHKW